jgi:hypothetical protein
MRKTANNPANSFSVLVNQSTPALQIRPAGETTQLRWPDWAGYQLETSTNLAFATGWTAVTNLPFVAGGQRTLLASPDSDVQFFRLRKP